MIVKKNEFKLTRDYGYDDREFNDEIIVNKSNFLIDGQGHTLNGISLSAFFKINGDNVTLKNINFINGLSLDGPGKIKNGTVNFNGSGCVLQSCNFTNNADHCGLVVCFEGFGIVDACIFNRNFGCYRGILEFKKGGIVNSSTFKNNDAMLGGTILSHSDSYVEDTHFENNIIRDFECNNSDIFMVNPNDTLTIIQTPFYDNPNDFAALNKLINECNENPIVLDKDYVFRPSSDFIYITGVPIVKDFFVIDGAGHSIDGCNLARLFNIKGKTPILKNIVFKNGFSTSNGGAILAKEIILENCTFMNNTGALGGAVFAQNALIKNCNFTDNNATAWGGSVSINKTATIRGCHFENSYASQHGGAVYAKDLIMSDSQLVNNEAFFGGAIDSDYADIDSCVLLNNRAVNSGGAIYVQYNATLNHIICENNLAAMFGGSLRVMDTAIVSGSHFSNSTSNDDGGAINAKNAMISGCTFDDCISGYAGGAVYSANDSLIDECTFENNHAVVGGALYLNGTSKVKNSHIYNNTATAYGRGIYFNGNKYFNILRIINGTDFLGNVANEVGDSVYTRGNLTVDSSKFNNSYTSESIHVQNGCVLFVRH